MNRNFRVWSKVEKKFVKDRLVSDDGYVYDWVSPSSMEVELEPFSKDWPNSDGGSMYVVQYSTGKKDSKGEEIYEGDIIYYRHKFDHGDLFEGRAEVVWDEEIAAFSFDGFTWLDSNVFWDSIRVVGNKFQ